MPESLKTLASFLTPLEAEMARNRLEEEGIRAFLADEHTVGWLWHLGTALKGVKLLVAESDLPRAMETLAAVEEAKPGAEERRAGEELGEEEDRPRRWTCSKCGANIDAPMDVCWACGTAADGTEDPEFCTADAYTASPPREEDEDEAVGPPNPLLTSMIVLLVVPLSLVTNSAILSCILGVNALVIISGSLVGLLLMSLLLVSVAFALIGIFQHYYYLPPSREERDALAEAPADSELEADEEWDASELELLVAARRACLAALLGVTLLPLLMNFYSLWILAKHELYRETARRKYGFFIYSAIVLNALAFLIFLFVLVASAGH